MRRVSLAGPGAAPDSWRGRTQAPRIGDGEASVVIALDLATAMVSAMRATIAHGATRVLANRHVSTEPEPPRRPQPPRRPYPPQRRLTARWGVALLR